LPTVVAWAAVTAMHQSRAVSISLTVIIASIVLALETYGAMRFIGRSLAKAEPLQTA
jgi:hypothetical protein